MNNGWRTVTLGEVAQLNPRRELKKGVDAPHVAMDGLQPHARKVATVGSREFKGSGSRFTNGDTLLARITPCLENGKTAYVDRLPQGQVGHGSTEFIVISCVEGVTDNLFLYYLCRHPGFRSFAIKRMEGTSGRQRVPHAALQDYSFALPPLEEQLKIAHILGSLDNKIELNRKMNETLEAMARAIFKSWFVDFDPVKAKAEGRQPCGMDADTAALFPDSFEDSELGMIPKGWSAGKLSDVVEFQSGFSFKSKDWQDSGVPVVKIGSVKPGVIDLDNVSYVNDSIAEVANRFRLCVGDLLVGMTGYVGEVGIVPPTENLPLLNQRVGKFVSKPNGVSGLPFPYCITRSPDFKAHAVQRSHGTAQANVSGKDLVDYPVVMPPQSLIDMFNQIMGSHFRLILSNLGETATLVRLRDALLPRLVSGELSVSPEPDLSGDAQ